MSLAAHGSTLRYEQGCGCSRCVLAMAQRDNDERHRRMGPARQRLAAPPGLARCAEGCGRLVWHFDLGLCGRCARGVAA